ncbi:hypothetical protein RhiirA4_521915 [Rhizophagus irregularis]|uniref:Uncharacterized protein n=1 Tax=Rhizophagus irregularis TaxID=588596 RepID=A0A2I1HR44_9GLOM|nr:hypothetical protein RhiirA4_521915 [Rhizophagus irregularis]
MTKLNNLYDGRVEKKRQSMKSGELDEKINNNSADLLEHMIQACNDPENPTLTSERITTANALTTILYLLAVHKDLISHLLNKEYLCVLYAVIGQNSFFDLNGISINIGYLPYYLIVILKLYLIFCTIGSLFYFVTAESLSV